MEVFLMHEYHNITLVKAANVYFDGKVTSRTVKFLDGSKKTLGIMLPGEYEFSTAEAEIMEIISGELTVLLPEQVEWQVIGPGDTFVVPANSAFKLNVTKVVDYCCSYLK